MTLHPLRTARPTDPYLALYLDESVISEVRIEGDHVAYVRPGRRGNETWVTALGDDARTIRKLIEQMMARVDVDGIHVHDHVYAELPQEWQIPDHGHWSIWMLPEDQPPPEVDRDVRVLSRDDSRISALLEHSDSAYVFPGHPRIEQWLGMEDGDELVAVGALTALRGAALLVSICTHPDRRGQGLGRRLTGSLLRYALQSGPRTVALEMRVGNAAAARVYSSLGMREEARYRSGFLPGRPRASA